MIRLETNTNPLLEGWIALHQGLPPNFWRFRGGPPENPTGPQVQLAIDLLQVADDEEIRALGRYLSDGFMLGMIAPHALRRAAVKKWAWAIPTNEALDLVAGFSPIVEVGAGTGYWASLLAQRGADVVAYDQYPPGLAENHWHDITDAQTFFPVDKAGIEVVARHPDRTLFLCWPPYAPSSDVRFSAPEDPEGWERDDFEIGERSFTHWSRPNDDPDIAYIALEAYAAAGGRRVIYIGEGPGGCTAGDEFHARLFGSCGHFDEVCTCPEKQWTEVADLAIPQWYGLHDHLWVFERA